MAGVFAGCLVGTLWTVQGALWVCWDSVAGGCSGTRMRNSVREGCTWADDVMSDDLI